MRPTGKHGNSFWNQYLRVKLCADFESGSSDGTFVMQHVTFLFFSELTEMFIGPFTLISALKKKATDYRRLLRCCIVSAVPSPPPSHAAHIRVVLVAGWYGKKKQNRIGAAVTPLGCGSWRPGFKSHSNPNTFLCIFYLLIFFTANVFWFHSCSHQPHGNFSSLMTHLSCRLKKYAEFL